MPNIRKNLTCLRELKKQIDRLTEQMGVGEYYTVEIDVGDYWASQKELEVLSKGTTQERVVNAVAADMRPLSLTKKADKPTLLRIQWNLTAIIDWLGSLEVTEVYR